MLAKRRAEVIKKIALAFGILSAGVVQAAELRVWDGDTFTLSGERFRLLGVDAPELFSSKCEAEKRLAKKARARLQQLLGDGEGLVLQRHEQDRFKRTLVVVVVDGRSVGEVLVKEEFAREWKGKRESWCSCN
jgi:endonuclease YncB( thermonuclease family)